MSIKVMSYIWQQRPDIKGCNLIILLALADSANDQGYTWIGVRTLAKKTRIDVRRLQRHVQALIDQGELLVYDRHDDEVDTQCFSNVYVIPLDDVTPVIEVRGKLSLRGKKQPPGVAPAPGGGGAQTTRGVAPAPSKSSFVPSVIPTTETQSVSIKSLANDPPFNYGGNEGRVSKTTEEGAVVDESPAGKYVAPGDFTPLERKLVQMFKVHNPNAQPRLTFKQRLELRQEVVLPTGEGYPSPEAEYISTAMLFASYIEALPETPYWNKNFIQDKRSVTLGELIKMVRGYHFAGGWLKARPDEPTDYVPKDFPAPSATAGVATWLKRK